MSLVRSKSDRSITFEVVVLFAISCYNIPRYIESLQYKVLLTTRPHVHILWYMVWIYKTDQLWIRMRFKCYLYRPVSYLYIRKTHFNYAIELLRNDIKWNCFYVSWNKSESTCSQIYRNLVRLWSSFTEKFTIVCIHPFSIATPLSFYLTCVQSKDTPFAQSNNHYG